MKKSWKTTLGGILASVGITLGNSEDKTLSLIGQILSAAGTFIIGISARDNAVSSEEVGIKK